MRRFFLPEKPPSPARNETLTALKKKSANGKVMNSTQRKNFVHRASILTALYSPVYKTVPLKIKNSGENVDSPEGAASGKEEAPNVTPCGFKRSCAANLKKNSRPSHCTAKKIKFATVCEIKDLNVDFDPNAPLSRVSNHEKARACAIKRGTYNMRMKSRSLIPISLLAFAL